MATQRLSRLKIVSTNDPVLFCFYVTTFGDHSHCVLVFSPPSHYNANVDNVVGLTPEQTTGKQTHCRVTFHSTVTVENHPRLMYQLGSLIPFLFFELYIPYGIILKINPGQGNKGKEWE